MTEVRRAIREALGRFEFGPGEVATTLAHLGTECVFCDVKATHWDLLVPQRSGGEVVLGNVVPVCGPCYGSKREQDFEEWLHSSRANPALQGVKNASVRVKRLRAHMRRHGYAPTDLDQRLSADGRRALEAVRRCERELRMAVRELGRVAVIGGAAEQGDEADEG